MKLRLSRRSLVRIALLLAGAGIVTSVVTGNESEKNHSHQTTPTLSLPLKGRADTASKSVPSLDVIALGRAVGTATEDKLFYIPPPPPPPRPVAPPPPPPPAVQAPPPKPTAPPLPFTYIGRLLDSGTTKVFVTHNGQRLILKQGDKAGDLYHVERVSEIEIVFVYEPLSERQVLAMGVPK